MALLGVRPCSLPSCAASFRDLVTALSFAGPGDHQLYFRYRERRCLIRHREGGWWGPGQSGRGEGMPHALCSAPSAPSCPAGMCPRCLPKPRKGHFSGCQRPPGPAVSSCLGFPSVPFLAAPRSPGGWEGVWGPAAPAARLTSLVWVGRYLHPEPPAALPDAASSVTRETAPCREHGPAKGGTGAGLVLGSGVLWGEPPPHRQPRVQRAGGCQAAHSADVPLAGEAQRGMPPVPLAGAAPRPSRSRDSVEGRVREGDKNRPM